MSLITSILTTGNNSHLTTSEEANRFLTLFTTPGVIGAFTSTTGAYAITAQGTPDNTVNILAGDAIVAATPSTQGSQNLNVRNSATIIKTIQPNVTGSTYYDWFYLAIDATKANNPAVDASDVATIIVNRSTNNTTDTIGAPAYAEKLGIVTVAPSFTNIATGAITSTRRASQPAINAGGVTAAMIETQQAWQTPTYSSGWVDYDAGTSGLFGGIRYYKDSLGIVHLKGMMKSGTITAGTVMLTLPAGYRPGNTLLFEVTSNDARARLDVTNAGTILAGSGVAAAWVSCANISFRAEA